MPESGIREFGEWVTQEEWAQVAQADGPDEKLEQLTKICTQKINHIFPEKNVKMSNQDLPFITWKLKEMKRKLKRLYRAKGRKQEYLSALSEYETEFRKTSTEYLNRNVSELETVDPARAAAILKRLGGTPGDCGDKGQFTVLSHQSQNLSTEESTARILKYFTDISKEFEPLNVSTLPVRVKVKLLSLNQESGNLENG